MLGTAFTVEHEHYPLLAPRRSKPAVRVALAQLAARMLDELNGNRLEVVLVPDRHLPGADWRMLRCAEAQNAPWYREFCGLYESNRRGYRAKFQTRIKRRETIAALRRIVGARDQEPGAGEKTPYVERLLEFMEAIRGDAAALRVYRLG